MYVAKVLQMNLLSATLYLLQISSNPLSMNHIKPKRLYQIEEQIIWCQNKLRHFA